MLAIPIIIIVTVFVLSLTWLAYVLARQQQVKRGVMQAVLNASAKDIDNVYEALAQMSDGPPKAYILARTNLKAAGNENQVKIPVHLSKFPWAGKTVRIDTSIGINMVVEDSDVQYSQLGGNVYKNVPAPLADNETGEGYTLFSPYKWLDGNQRLLSNLCKISQRFPEQVLSYLVTTGRELYSYEPSRQARIGDGVTWIHKPQVPVCETCGERMRFILQLPGSLLDGAAEKEAVYYLFGCAAHPHQTHCVIQYY
jgi:hypothetical protein